MNQKRTKFPVYWGTANRELCFSVFCKAMPKGTKIWFAWGSSMWRDVMIKGETQKVYSEFIMVLFTADYRCFNGFAQRRIIRGVPTEWKTENYPNADPDKIVTKMALLRERKQKGETSGDPNLDFVPPDDIFNAMQNAAAAIAEQQTIWAQGLEPVIPQETQEERDGEDPRYGMSIEMPQMN